MSGYLNVLRVPGALAFSGSAAIARLAQAMLGLGSVLLLTQLGRSFAVAGLVAGCIAVAQGVVGPRVSRSVDRRGQRAVVLPQLVIHAASVAGLVWAGSAAAPTWVLVVVALVTGASLPQTGALVRARWTALLGGGTRLDRALALESLIEEAAFVVGPVLVTALAIAVAPAAGLLTALGLAIVGCGLLLAQHGTEPVPEPSRPVAVHRAGRNAAPARRDSALSNAGLLVIVGTFVAMGALFGFVEVGVVALARQFDAAGAAGTMLGLWAAGSLAAGVVYGARTWHAGATARFQASAGAMAAGAVLIAVAAESGSLPATTAALIVAGLANAPTLITGNMLVPRVVLARNLTEAYTWLNVSIFAGIAVGSALGGVLIDRDGPGAALWAAAAAGVFAAALPLFGNRSLP